MTLRIYLAGPDVFARNPFDIASQKKDLCSSYGFEGVFPLDNHLDPGGLSPQGAAMTIYRSNIDLMLSCDACIANMTPFRGPSMDCGTAFEMGFMAARGKPVLGYTTSPDLFFDRTTSFLLMHGGETSVRPDGSFEDQDQMQIESFGLVDNLMLDGSVIMSEFQITHGLGLTAFEECLRQLQSTSSAT
jgi:nucleoside 2-deoxyribosyltransferase